MSEFLESIREVQRNYNNYEQWEQNQADDVAKRRHLSKILDLPKDKVEYTRAKSQAIFRASDMIDKRSEDNCADVEQLTGIVSTAITIPLVATIQLYQNHLSKKAKAIGKKQSIYVNGALWAIMIATNIGIILWGTKKQKEASRIGRFQAKQNELKDAKNFVIYTPEQIEEANKIAKDIPDVKNKKNILESFSSIKQMSKDNIKYQEYKKHSDIENKIQKINGQEFSLEQLIEAEEDKEAVVNIVKDVNMNAETYAENVENIFDTINLMSGLSSVAIGFGINKVLKNFKSVSPKVKSVVSIAAASLFGLGMLFWGTREKKQASRVGRFAKSQEILNNPELVMAYTDEQLKSAKNINHAKVEKKFWSKIKDNFTFFKKYLREGKEYKIYKNTTLKENQKFYEALKQVKISDKQLKEAKNLQEKIFLVFDKIDETSQRYSEDTEAATQIMLELATPLLTLTIGSIPVPIILAFQKGKIPLMRIIEFASNVALKKDSELKNLLNKAGDVINKDKDLKKDFSKIFINKKVQEKFINNVELQKLYIEFARNNQNYMSRIKKATEIKDIKEIQNVVKEIFNKNAKQDNLSKWIRNLAGDIFALTTNIKNKSAKNTIIKPVEKAKAKTDAFKIIKKFHNEYKTLSKTILYGGFVPIIGIAVGVPFIISSWLTNIQLKAGRIGIMKAMEEVDNPKLFVKEHEVI